MATCPSRRGAPSCLVLGVLVGVALWFVPAFALATPEKAAELFDRAMEHAARAEYDPAVRDFQQAYAASPNPVVLYNLAQVYAAMGRSADAVRTFHRYLAEAGAKLDVEKRERIQQQVAEQLEKVARLRLTLKPEQAVAFINDEPVATSADGSVVLEPGRVQLIVRAPQHRTDSRDLILEAGEDRQLTLELEPERLQQTHTVLTVRCDVPGTQVLLDDELVSSFRSAGSKTIRVAVGAQRLQFKKHGFSGRVVRLEAPLDDAPIDCGLRSAEPPAAKPAHQPAEVRETPTGSYGSQRAWALALTGGGLGMMLSAGVIWSYNSHREGDWQRLSVGLCESPSSGAIVPCDDPERPLTQQERDALSLRDSIRRWDNVSLGLAMGSAATLGGALVLFLSASPKHESAAVRTRLLVGPGSVGCRVTF